MPTAAKKPRAGRVRARAKTAKGLRIPSLRTREGKELLAFREALIRHVGGKPSETELALIDRAMMLKMNLNRMDEEAAAGGRMMSDHATRVYLAWSNSMARTLKLLRLKAAAESEPSLSEYMATRESA